MSPVSHDWSFLPEAWKYALVLGGRESAATALLTGALTAISKRPDVWESSRMRRLLFSTIHREGNKSVRISDPVSPAERDVFIFHGMAEPGRSAVALLCLELFSGEHLAGLLGLGERELVGVLQQARDSLATTLPPPA